MADWAKCFDAAILVQFGKEARQTRPSVAFALSAQALWNRAARPDPSLRKERLLRMTIKPRHHQRCLLLLHSTVLDHRQNRTDHRQADQNSERRFVVSIEETEDMAVVAESQGGLDEVANPSAQHQGCQEFFSRVLHGACGDQKWKERKRRRQQRGYHNCGESPAG